MLNLSLFVLCVLFFSTADYYAARWGYSRELFSLLVVMVIGPFAYLLFGYLTANTSLSKMASYVCVGIIICSTFAGVVFLGERPNRLTWVALSVVIIGLVLLGLSKVERPGA